VGKYKLGKLRNIYISYFHINNLQNIVTKIVKKPLLARRQVLNI